METLPLEDLFMRLREAGVPLGLGEYQLALKALQAGYGIADRASLARTCKALWVKSPEDARIFDHYFDQYFAEVAEIAAPSPPAPDRLGAPAAPPRRSVPIWLLLLPLLFVLLVPVIAIFFMPGVLPQATRPTLPAAQISPAPATASPVATTARTPQGIQIPGASRATPAVPLAQATRAPTIASPTPTGASSATVLGFLLFSLIFIVPYLLLIGVVVIIDRLRAPQRERRRTYEQDEFTPDHGQPPVLILSSQLMRDLSDETLIARALQHVGAQGHDLDQGARVYVPANSRQIKQSWRFLRYYTREGPRVELDMHATIRHIGEKGMFVAPILAPLRRNKAELLLLIDRDGSMAPFHGLTERVVDAVVAGGRLGRAEAYYFHNCPGDYLYHDPVHTRGQALDDLLRQLQATHTFVAIVSDAGAARGGLSPRRRRLTRQFLQRLRPHVRQIVWLNPLPRARWPGTTAAGIADLVPMFDMSRYGFEAAVSVLRGLKSPTPHE